MTVLERLADWFGTDDDWDRPAPPVGWGDVVLALAVFLLGALAIESVASMSLGSRSRHLLHEYLALATGSALLITRRRLPLLTMVTLGVHFWITCTWVPQVGYSFVYQLIPFAGLYSGLAWAQSRRNVVIATAALAGGFTVWLVWEYALGSGLEGIGGGDGEGIFTPTTGAVIFVAICNLIYFLAAVLMGNVAWRQARLHAHAIEQARLIREQTDQIAEHAVTEERLRLARELHDVVAHHIAVTGVQAGAARAVLRKDADRAASALQAVEDSSREAITQMRQLLVALRSDEEPEHLGLDDIDDLTRAFDGDGVSIDLAVVESSPGARSRVPLPVGLACYRVMQEALSNVRRHSTARRVDVSVRVDESAGFAEVEVVDDGTPRQGTGGSGFGQRGMRERVGQLNGLLELGPRVGCQGYRVRARLPLA